MHNIIKIYDDYFDTTSKKDKYNTQFQNDINKLTTNLFAKLNNKYIESVQHESKIDTEQKTYSNETNKKTEINTKKIKDVYKKIILHTHPDKSNNTKIEFSEVKHAYTEKILSLILYYSYKCDIEYSLELSDHEVIIIEQELVCVKQQINDMKSSICWKWCTGTEKDKEIILNEIKEKYS